ncbi:trithorax group protein osa-like [Anopheles darlingi]|uniref:trithorax group protein osa-like n=1 Tax=Anopheles darlingi TaxID=43151 RepID=UPI0021003BE5|nr:trithorax group protein osa-like [Anopheles darlingi]
MMRVPTIVGLITSCLLLQTVVFVVGAGHDPPPSPSNRPTQLEDIERDNLNSERQVFKKEAIAQQQQQLGASSTQSNNHYSLQIQHHPGSTAAAHSAVKYVTPLPAPQQITYTKEQSLPQQFYNHQPQQQQQPQPQQFLHYQPQLQQQPVPQVHEDHSTYTVPSRQSLLQPVIGGSAPSSPYLTPQPQYVYVQARPQQQMQYASGQSSLPQSLLHILPQNSQAYIMIPTQYYQQQPSHLPSEVPSSAPHSAQQLAAYVNDPDNHIETYSHGETGAQSPSAPPVNSIPSDPAAQTQSTSPTPDIVYAPSSTPAPPRHQSPSSEFSIVKSIEQPIYYSHDLPAPLPSPTYNKDLPQHTFIGPLHNHHHHHHQQQQVAHRVPQFHLQQQLPHHEGHAHFAGPHFPQTQHVPQHTPSPVYPSLNHPNNGILNYFGVQHRPPTSLLDSYVPSALQLHKNQPVFVPKHRPALVSFYQPGYPFIAGPHHHHHPHHQQQHHAYSVNPLHTTILQPAAGPIPFGHQHQQAPQIAHAAAPGPLGPVATAPAYNTIAYSVPLAFTKTSAQYKRSPALFSVAGFLPKIPALGGATTKLQPSKPLP